jgi:hypothetical protein
LKRSLIGTSFPPSRGDQTPVRISSRLEPTAAAF